MSSNSTRKANTICLVCGKPVYRRPRQLTLSKGKVFCSMRCYGFSCRKEGSCVVCGKNILASLHKKTCSRSCSNIHRTGIQYKIGRPKDNARTQRYIKISLLEKRGYKCERCGYNKSEILQVHHRNRNRKDNRLENLEIICPNCHYNEHRVRETTRRSGSRGLRHRS